MDISSVSGEKIVNTQHLISFFEQTLTKVAAEKSSTTTY
jgi:hypothetical protein